MLKKIIGTVVLASAFLFIGCTPPVDGVRPPENTNFGKLPKDYKTRIIEVESEGLRDPYSARFTFGKPYRAYINHKDDGRLFWTGHVVPFTLNAKNAYGGYIGIQHYIAVFNKDGSIELTGSPAQYSRIRKF